MVSVVERIGVIIAVDTRQRSLVIVFSVFGVKERMLGPVSAHHADSTEIEWDPPYCCDRARVRADGVE
jgi:hypothetical protein